MTEILQYIPGKGILHRLNPVTKLIIVVLIVGMSVLTPSAIFLAGLILVIAIGASVSGMYREISKQIPFLIMLGVFLLLVTTLTVQQGVTYFTLIPASVPLIGGMLPITEGGFGLGLLFTFRFIVMILSFHLFIVTTKPSELVTALLAFHMPVDYILMFLIALRFIPSLQLEATRIHEAQLSRGYNPGTGAIGKVKSLRPIIIPLVANSLAKTQVLGLTLDLRGYRSKKTLPFHELEFHRIDSFSLIFIGVVVIVYFIYHFG
ncbi:energy-coupling factor transporter transmembrane component T family protein [Methanospirillum lacunae]|uniref:Energy-coupling factor transporter transmembrane protein EcfT n=1 Tax=Methanospirillum lacunae TaxID=668570 RepID=A0A2V2MVY1_9EURY|nr:energy-coupling factor transporter transmembrane component T [Methanospirillum lacunae]PWR71529.1 energy-coupling factor transporter transmembrane protein EcfT [Methanospirillum lacunae]